MAISEKAAASSFSPWWMELFATGMYKRSQGKVARQATFFAILVLVLAGAWVLYEMGNLGGWKLTGAMRYVVPTAIALVGAWLGFRAVNIPQFADFLIAVEAEMNKVSWPGWEELKRASLVVILLMVALTVVLFAYDMILRAVLGALGVIPV